MSKAEFTKKQMEKFLEEFEKELKVYYPDEKCERTPDGFTTNVFYANPDIESIFQLYVMNKKLDKYLKELESKKQAP